MRELFWKVRKEKRQMFLSFELTQFEIKLIHLILIMGGITIVMIFGLIMLSIIGALFKK